MTEIIIPETMEAYKQAIVSFQKFSDVLNASKPTIKELSENIENASKQLKFITASALDERLKRLSGN